MDDRETLAQLDGLLTRFQILRKSSNYSDLSDHDISVITSFNSACLATINRISGDTSVYSKSASAILDRYSLDNSYATPGLHGIVDTLRSDVENGHLRSYQELIHADVFSDFLEMAEYLLSQGFKDAAAVLAGGTLEEHLRHLCIRCGVTVEVLRRSDVAPKPSFQMNDELAQAGVYSKNRQKQVGAWLGIRNSAAHGKYSEYDQPQVELLVQGLRDFIAAYPA